MQIAVFSDIHGNYIAFQKCLDYALSRNIDTFIFLGDYLGEFPYPQKTMKMLYSMRDKYTCYFVKGNKEDYWLDRKYNHNCIWKDGNHTVGAMHYTYENQTPKDLAFYEELTPTLEINIDGALPILACHGSPNRNNEKMLPDNEKTYKIMSESGYQYILCGHTHIQGAIPYDSKIALNPGAVGVPLHSNGKTQFMILTQNNAEWTHEFISLDYEREPVIRELQESGLFAAAPYWSEVTKHLLLTGEVSHASVLFKAMSLCEKKTDESNWYAVPDKYWKQAIDELLA